MSGIALSENAVIIAQLAGKWGDLDIRGYPPGGFMDGEL